MNDVFSFAEASEEQANVMKGVRCLDRFCESSSQRISLSTPIYSRRGVEAFRRYEWLFFVETPWFLLRILICRCSMTGLLMKLLTHPLLD